VHTWGGKSFHNQLNLIRLSNRESLLMVKHLLGAESIEGNLEELILEKTEGVPFFIEEFLKSLRELKIIEKIDDTYHIVADTKDVKIPSTIQDVIMARVDSLPEGAKELLQTGSVIEREFNYGLIKRVAGLPEKELLSRLSALRDSELLYERGIYPKSTYIFKHALTQEVAYNSLLLKRRKEIHEKTACAIEELYEDRLEEYYELLAYHYVRSDNKEKAVEYLGLASKKATTATAMEDAKTYFEEARKVLDALPDIDENRVRRISLLNSQWTAHERRPSSKVCVSRCRVRYRPGHREPSGRCRPRTYPATCQALLRLLPSRWQRKQQLSDGHFRRDHRNWGQRPQPDRW